MDTRGPIETRSDTPLVGLDFLADPELKPVRSRAGMVRFVALAGLTADERRACTS